MNSSGAVFIHKPTSLVNLLRLRGTGSTNQRGYAFFRGDDVEDQWLRFEDLHLSAERVAAALQSVAPKNKSHGDHAPTRVIVFASPSPSYLQAFFGTLYAKMVVVTAYPPRARRRDSRLDRVVEDSGATIALAETSVFERREALIAASPQLANLRWLNIDQLASESSFSYHEVDAQPSDLAVLQYTSGSTSDPKGVCLTHGNLLANLQMIYESFELGTHEDLWAVTWLPPFHDMGLIGGLLQSIYAARSTHVIPPAAFVQKPARWLRAITKYRAAISGGPNFSYDLCVDKIPPNQRETLDLSSWELAFTGAEPIRKATLDRFASAFAPSGFDKRAFFPCYGLAEATLLVSGGPRFRDPQTFSHQETPSTESPELVSCGRIAEGIEVKIVDPKTLELCPEGKTGEVWISGDNVSDGYWNQTILNQQLFNQRLFGNENLFLRTGDLGLLKDGELYITGRLKEMIVIRGRNFQPSEIEAIASNAHPLCVHNGCAAIEIIQDGEVGLALVQEIERVTPNHTIPETHSTICLDITEKIVEAFDLKPLQICLISKRTLPKTSSGKIKRLETKTLLLQDGLEILFDSANLANHPTSTSDAISKPRSHGKRAISSQQLTEWLGRRLAEHLSCSSDSIDRHRPLTEYGLDSVSAVQLAGELETYLGESIPPTLFYDAPTIQAIADTLRPPQATKDSASHDGLGAISETRSQSTESKALDEVVITGLSCRLPGCNSIDQYWNLLRAGKSCISLPPPDRLKDLPPDLHETYGGWLSNIDKFDAELFGISPREASAIDPQHRIVLESVWRAIEDARIDPKRLRGTKTGVFVGISNRDYERYLRDRKSQLSVYDMTGNAASMVAHRVSYHFDLIGPSLAIDTACSSSLVALHQAIRSIQSGDCELAIVAGVNLMLSPEVFETLRDAQMLSPDHTCHTFDAKANGYVRGEGCIALLISSQSVAQRRGLPQRAIICASAINQDGLTAGITAPNGQSQVRLYQAALHNAHLNPEVVELVEAHGTGTSLGDPIEFHSLNAVYGRPSKPNSSTCALAAVKSNLGHLEAASGLASLVKVVLQLERGEIVPQPHFDSPNPLINFHGSRLQIPLRPTPWATPQIRYAAVSSFGFGGTNAHVIVRSAEKLPSSAPIQGDSSRTKDCLITLSAHSRPALEELASTHAKWIAQNPQLSPQLLSQSLMSQKSSGKYRIAFVDHQLTAIGSRLRRFGDGKMSSGIREGVQPTNRKTSIGFLFSGSQAPTPKCGNQLFKSDPTFQYWINCIADYVAGHLHSDSLLSLKDKTTVSSSDAHGSSHLTSAKPGDTIRLFAIQFATAKTLLQWGIQPSVVCGYGTGEYAAAAFADAIPWEFAVEALHLHANSIRTDHEQFHAMVVLAPLTTLSPILADLESPPELRSIDTPDHLVFIGTVSQVKTFKTKLDEANLPHRDVPDIHKALWLPSFVSQHRLRSLLQTITLKNPSCDFISSITGSQTSSEIANPNYWIHHWTSPLQFAGAIESLAALDIDVNLEIGPGNSMGLLMAMGHSKLGSTIPVMPDLHHEYAGLLSAIGELYVRGVDLSAAGPLVTKPAEQISLPGHPLHGCRHWVETTADSIPLQSRTTRVSDVPTVASSATSVVELIASARQKAETPQANILTTSDNHSLHADVTSYEASLPSLNHILRLFIAHALRSFLPSTSPGTYIEEEALCNHPELSSKHRQLVRRFVQILAADDGILRPLTSAANHWEIIQFPRTSESQLRSELSRTERTYPILKNELTLVSRCGFALREILRGDVDPLQILFPNGDSSVLRALYSESPVAVAANALVTETSLHAIATMREMAPKQPIRILEVGGGTGGTTRGLVAALANQIDEYCFTDASPLLVAHARDTLPSIAPLHFELFDIEQSPEAQNIPLGHFDIVIAANVLHATMDLRQTLRNLQKSMKPNGFLIALEGIRPQPFLDFVFGLTEGWWRFKDKDLRKDYPLLSIESWRQLFQEQSFDSFEVSPYPKGLESVGNDQAVLLAQTSSDMSIASEHPAKHSGNFARHSSKHASHSVSQPIPGPAQNPWTARFLNATGPARKSSLEGYFLFTLDQVLQRNGQWLDLDAPVNTLGVDSLLAIQLQNRLRSDLGLSIPMVAFLQGSSTRQLITAALDSQPANSSNRTLESTPALPSDTTEDLSSNPESHDTSVDNSSHDPSMDRLLIDGIQKPASSNHKHASLTSTVDRHATETDSAMPPLTESTGAMSVGQQSLWFLYQRAPESAAYNFAFAAKTQQKIKLDALVQACEILQRRHEALRTAYRWEDGKAKRIILAQTKLNISVEDASDTDESRLLEKVRHEADQPFDLANGQVIRFRIYSRDNGDILSIAMHHIAADLWSMDLLIQELQLLYTQAMTGTEPSLPPLEGNFESYVQWETSLDTSDEGKELWRFWEERLSDAPQVLQLPTSHPRPAEQTYSGASYQWTVDKETESRLRELAKSEKTTLYTVLLTAYQAYLARVCQQDDLLVGTVSTTRIRSDWEGLVGYFLNHLVLRTQLKNTPSFLELLRKTKEDLLQSLQHQAFPFAKLVQRLRPQRDNSRSPLVQTMFIWDKPRANQHYRDDNSLSSINLQPILMEQRGAAFDLTFIVFELEHELQISLRYNTDLFDRDTIQSLSDSFQQFLGEIIEQPEIGIRHAGLVSKNQMSKIHKWNDTSLEFDPLFTGYKLFHQWVIKSPSAIAIESTTSALTYFQVEQMVNILAAELHQRGVCIGDKVAILMRRGIEPLIGILATWKLGAAYIPLDPDHPTARLQNIIDDAKPKAILTNQNALSQHALQIKCVQFEFDLPSLKSSFNHSETSLPAIEYSPDSPAYVIYTSGSTGRPKGVVVPYRGVANLAVAQAKLFNIQPSDRCLQFASLSFDASVFEMMMAFHAGATLVVLDSKTVRSTTSEIRDSIAESKVTVATLPPSLLSAIPEENLTTLHTLISAGEALSEELVQKWGTDRRLFNAYGPTETTVWATTHLCKPTAGKPSLGNPISNTRIYVTDRSLELLPIGIPGELCIAGAGLATCYHGLSELTADRFVPNPFDSVDDATLYRTGDLAKWNPSGEIEFLGRIDSQVKIHGNRVETEEIAAQLRHCAEIADAFVKLDHSKAEPRIIAYVVPTPDSQTSDSPISNSPISNSSEKYISDSHDDSIIHADAIPKTIDFGALRKQLALTMPCYMLPAEYLTVPRLPLTVNGKVDVSKLPPPTSIDLPQRQLIHPTTPTEKSLFDIWTQVLERQDISINDNFFDIGGASLTALQAAELAKSHGFAITAEQLFQYQTIRELAEEIDRSILQDECKASPEHPSLNDPSDSNEESPLFLPEAPVIESQIEAKTPVVSESNTSLLRMGIESLGMYLPPKTASTTAIVEGCRRKLDFPLERMTGIESRHVAGETEFSIDLARRAAEDCLSHSLRKPEDIDLLIACNISRYDGPDFEISFEPSTAVRLKAMLGAINAEAFDICNACAGFFTALLIAQNKLLSGEARHVMIVSGEYISHLSKTAQLEIEGFLDPRLACLTLGDAGIAMIVELRDDGSGFEALELFTKGQHHDLCIAKETEHPHGGAIMYTDAIKASAVTLNYAVDHAADTLRKHAWKPEKIEHVIIHQTSSTTIDGAVEQLNRHFGPSIEAGVKAVNNLRFRGNTATTTHWVAVMDLIRQGRIHDEDHVVFAISGSGQTIGTALYKFDQLPSRLTSTISDDAKSPLITVSPPQVCGVKIASATSSTALKENAKHEYSEFSVVELAAIASQKALRKARWSKDCVEMMIHAGVYRDDFLSEPAVAAILAGCLHVNTDEVTRTGNRTLAFDLSDGAVGPLAACSVIATIIRNGQMGHGIVTASEVENNSNDLPQRNIAAMGSAIALEAAPPGIGFGTFLLVSYTEFRDDIRVFTNQGPKCAELVIHQSDQWLAHAQHCLIQTATRYAEEQGTKVDQYERILMIVPPGLATDEFTHKFGITPDRLVLPDLDTKDPFTSGLAVLWEKAMSKGTPVSGERWLLLSVGSGIQVGCVEYRH